MLQDCRILLAHEDSFQRGYLAEVIRESGGRLVGICGDWDGVVSAQGSEPAPEALVLGSTLVSQEALSLLGARYPQMAVLIVGAEFVDIALPKPFGRCLPAPCAGFQVVQALFELLGTGPMAGRSLRQPAMARSLTGSAAMPAIELWGGLECTVNRVGDDYRDQIHLSGHEHRLDDLDRFAEIGFTAIRYPVLWERTAPDAHQVPDWRWPDTRLQRLRRLGVRPIIGLVHHGSGPRHTNLLDEGFATGLERFAGAVAERYPWITEWTPVNEPLTTARFSALYGHWYPHVRDERAFWLALLNQVDGTRYAMKAIRRVTASAKLIQTDDLGKTYATAPLAGQAAYDNLRRWAGWDLLFGRLDAHHPLFEPLDRMGFGDRLRAIADEPCPPDVVGVNHYLTSDRFLDHRLDRYPVWLHGSNGHQGYADTEALRALDPPPAGLGGALREAWDRYATPLALTEVHNGSTRDEQMRWAAEAWDTAGALKAAGVDVRAVTAWSLLGSQGWDRLQRENGSYEPGLFDVAEGHLRPTALEALWRGLPSNSLRHPIVAEPGWWCRAERIIYGAAACPAKRPPIPRDGSALLIVGGSPSLDRTLADACRKRGLRFDLLAGAAPDEDAVNPSILALIEQRHPWAIMEVVEGGDRVQVKLSTPDVPHGLEAVCAERRIGYARLPRTAVQADNGAWLEQCLDRLIDSTGDRNRQDLSALNTASLIEVSASSN